MDSIVEFLYSVKDFLNPKFLIDYMLNLLGVYVYFGLFFVIFAETGLAVGFFLPGDSLLVVSGLFAAAGKLNVALVMLAFFLGSVIGAFYYIKIVKVMYFDAPGQPLAKGGNAVEGALIAAAALFVSPLGYLLIAPLGQLTRNAAESLF